MSATMTKVPTKEQIHLKRYRRLKSKSLQQVLTYRFLNHYGYDKGEITVKAIVDDILDLMENYFLLSPKPDGMQFLNYGYLTWMAVPVDEYPQRGKTIAATRLKPILLSFITDEDIAHIANGFDAKSLRKKKLLRWVDQAFDQGTVLTQLDLAALLGCCDHVISQYVQEIQKETGRILPTRGNYHDLSGAVTHKKEIITLYLEGYLTPEIAAKTNHSKEAVDRYIKDFHRVNLLWDNDIRDPDNMANVARLSKRVVQQYIDLLPNKSRFSKNNT